MTAIRVLMLLTLAVAGCEKAVPAPTKASLDSTNPKEQIDAARQAGQQFGGGTKP